MGIPGSAGTPTLEVDGGRATIRLHRPDKRNRIEPDDLAALHDHLTACEADEAVRVVVLAAEGPSWCSGYHLDALAGRQRPSTGFGDVCDQLERLAVPTIAALQGSVHGGGTDLAVACDLRIGVTGMVLGMPAARIGLQYYASGLRRFVERLGSGATKRIFLTGESITPDELLRIGYLTEVVEPERLETRIDALCAAVAGLAPGAVRRTKAAIDALARGGAAAEAIDAIEAGHRASLASAEHRDALAALSRRRSDPRPG